MKKKDVTIFFQGKKIGVLSWRRSWAEGREKKYKKDNKVIKMMIEKRNLTALFDVYQKTGTFLGKTYRASKKLTKNCSYDKSALKFWVKILKKIALKEFFVVFCRSKVVDLEVRNFFTNVFQ